MPHQCTQCGHTFPDGSKEMLSGCPECGGNKFQFKPTADARASGRAGESEPSPPSSEPSSSEVSPRADSAPDAATEDRAQADARREVVSEDELAADSSETGPEPDDTTEDISDEPTADAEESADPEGSNMAALRRELHDQFESIKILEPGQYELNLMELYNREEYIIALKEDGQYVIEVPDSWLGNDDR